MDSQHRKWVNLSYLVAAALLYYIVFSFSMKFAAVYDLETRVRNMELILRLVSIVFGTALFVSLYRHEIVNRFMGEVMLELSRVTWPTQKETSHATFIVIIMVMISGMILGVLDYIWTALLQWIL